MKANLERKKEVINQLEEQLGDCLENLKYYKYEGRDDDELKAKVLTDELIKNMEEYFREPTT